MSIISPSTLDKINNKISEAQYYLGENCEQQRYYNQFYRDGKLAVDIFKVENLEQSLNKIFDKFNWSKPKELLDMTPINTKLSKSKTSYREYYTNQLRDLVYTYNKDIIDRYNYSF